MATPRRSPLHLLGRGARRLPRRRGDARRRLGRQIKLELVHQELLFDVQFGVAAQDQCVAPLLAYLRELQRRHDVAVLVVHHAKKGGGGVRAGQALRGSSEFHAWGDSNLYLRRDGDDLSLSVEHRAAASMTPITIELAQRGTALALEVVDRRDPAIPPPSSLDERITATLAGADAALPFAELRACCRVRATTLYERLAVLAETGRVVKTDDGYRLADG